MLRNFLEIIGEGLRMDGAVLLFVWIITAAAVGALCWWLCTHYTRLWNRKFDVTTCNRHSSRSSETETYTDNFDLNL